MCKEQSIMLFSIEEIETCVYRFHVSAPFLCEFRKFQESKKKLVEPINCYIPNGAEIGRFLCEVKDFSS